MSAVLYPLSGFIREVRTQHFARNVVDRFEDGTQQARRLWAAQTFKRRFEVTHDAMSAQEFEYLRAFHAARSGDFDPFLFRNNAERLGNHYVRFAQPLQRTVNAAALRRLSVSLEEVQLQRELCAYSDVISAAGNTPLVWLDANREIYHTWKGTTYTDTAMHDASGIGTLAPTSNGVQPWDETLGGTSYPLSSHYSIIGAAANKSAGNVSLSGGTTPRLSIFALVNVTAGVSNAVVIGVGNQGLQLQTDNYFYPYAAGATFTTGKAENTGTLAWHSICVTWNNSHEAKIYRDGALIATESQTRSWSTEQFALGALHDDTEPLLSAGKVNNVLIFNATLTLAQIKALHNLVGWQVGLSEVA